MPVGRPGGGTKTRKGMFGGKGFGFDKPKPPPKPPPRKPKKPAPRTQSDVQTSGGGGYNAPPSAPLKPAPRTRSDVQTSGPDPYKPQYTRPKEPPDPQLAKHGINRSVFDFNDMLETTYNHFVGAYGRNPTPGLMFDLMRSPVQPDQVEHLFEVPDSTEHANAIGYQRKSPNGYRDVTRGVADLSEDPFLQQVGHSVRSGDFSKFVLDHSDALNQYLDDPKQVRDVLRAIYRAGGTKAQAKYAIDVTGLQHGRASVAQLPELQEAGFAPQYAYKPLEGFLGAVAKGVGIVGGAGLQAVGGLVFAPYGVYKLVDAGRKDVADAFTRGDFTPENTGNFIKEIGKSTYQTYRHPQDNLGYIFLDAFGLATGGAGIVARASTATRAAARREGAIAVTKALVKRPLPGTKTLTKGGIEEEALLSDNSLVRAAQRVSLERRQRFSDIRHKNGQRISSGFLAAVTPDVAGQFLLQHFSFETKIGRLARQRRRTETILADEVKRELEHVAGRSINQARVFDKFPKAARMGLSRGEQKAIQVLSTDDPHPLQTMRKFHKDMIELGIGDPKSHQRQLADLQLAEKVLDDPNPRGRFTKALQLTRDVVSEMERIKITELGLSPLTAESRVAAFGKVLRGEELISSKKLMPESFYLPTLSRAYSRRTAKYAFAGPRPGPYGVPPPRGMPELNHVYTGKAVQVGDMRIDATNLAGEAYGRTVRSASIWNEYKRLLSTSSDHKRNKFDAPIREMQKIPKKLRDLLAKVDEGELTATDAASLHPEDLKVIMKHLYPDETENIPGVRWVDSRLLGDARRVPAVPGAMTKTFQLINEPVRDVTLFLRPAYILNMVGNEAMLMMQNLANPTNVMRGTFAKKLYGEKTMRTIDSLVGQGRSRSYVAPEVEVKALKVGQALASSWAVVTDKVFRRASFIYWMRRYGFKTAQQADDLMHKPEHAKRLNEIKLRANKDLVEFDNLTHYEKNYLRHAVFVYPWMSRSFVWSLRTLVEHPIKTNALVKLGHEAQEDEDPILKQAPEWFQRSGYFPVSWTADGKPKVVNPTSINSFSTLSELLYTADAAFVHEVPYASAGDLLGPGAKFLIHAATGRDEYGNEYPGSDVWGAAQETIIGLPQARAIERAQKKEEPLRKFDVTDRRSLVTREHDALKRSIFGPGWLDGYGSLVAGGLSARSVDPDGVVSRYWQGQPIEKRLKHEQTLINKALGMQGDFLKRDVPDTVKASIDFNNRLTIAKAKHAEKLGRDPTKREGLELEIDLLAKGGHINQVEKAGLLKQMKTLDKTELQSFGYKIAQERPGTKDLKQWDEDVRTLYSFRKNVLNEKLGALKRIGLIDTGETHLSQAKLYEYGRRYIAYTKEVKKLQDETNHAEKVAPDELNNLYADMRVWEQQHDKPGKDGLPSLVRLAWAYTSPTQQASALLYHANSWPWEFMSNFDKELLGKKPKSVVAAGYAAVTRIITAETKASPTNSLPGYKRREQLYKYYDHYYPGLWADFQFGQKPKASRLLSLKLGYSKEMEGLLKNASIYSGWADAPGYTQGNMKHGWLDYVDKVVVPYLQRHPRFAAEVNLYGGPSFLSGLVEK